MSKNMKYEIEKYRPSVDPVNPTWIALGLNAGIGGHGSIPCFNSDTVYNNQYVKVADGVIISRDFNDFPIVNVHNSLLPDGYYMGRLYKKAGLPYEYFNYAKLDGQKCNVLGVANWEHAKIKKGDCAVRLEGKARNTYTTLDKLEFTRDVYVFCKDYQMIEDNAFVPSFTELRASSAYAGYGGNGISFSSDQDLNNERLSSVGMSVDRFVASQFLFANSPATPEFKSYITEQVELVLEPLISDENNWEENQVYDRYEGYRLKDCYMKSYALEALNKAVKAIFTEFKGKKYQIEKF